MNRKEFIDIIDSGRTFTREEMADLHKNGLSVQCLVVKTRQQVEQMHYNGFGVGISK